MRTWWLGPLMCFAWWHAAAGASDVDVLLDATLPGPVFEGIGACSAGASSRLLVEYPSSPRREILDYLFRPRYGASFQHLKVEIGGDVNSTDGVEPSHQHGPGDLNFHRGYEWWLMREARARNPRVLLDALAWGAPGWLGNGRFFSQDTADYIARFLQGARVVHGLDVQYVGILNETPYDPDFIKQLRGTLDRAGLRKVQIVAADQVNNWDLIGQMARDHALRDAVDVVGVHYPQARSPEAAQSFGKPLWSSEDGPWRGDWEGARALARMYNRNFVEGGMTKTIVWSPVTAYYDALPLPGSGVMRANEPWSGHYEVQPAVWATAHTTQFTEPGWRYLPATGCGLLAGGGSYVALRSPEGTHCSLIVETMDAREIQTLTIRRAGVLADRPLTVWRSNAREQFMRVARLPATSAPLVFRVEPESIYTLTTTRGQRKGGASGGRSRPFPTPWRDTFDGYTPGSTPLRLSDQAGVFEVHPRSDGGGLALRQVMDRKGIEWHYHYDPNPETVLGDRHWRDYTVRVDARCAEGGALSIFGRVSQVPQSAAPPDGYGFRWETSGRWELLASTNQLASGTLSAADGPWHRLELCFSGDTLEARVDGRLATRQTDRTFHCGMAAIGCGWHIAEFDNLEILGPERGQSASRTPPAPSTRDAIRPRRVSASSRWDFSYPAEAAADNDPASRWCSARDRGVDEWIELDFGQAETIGGVRIRPFDARIEGHRLQYWDGEKWSDAAGSGPVAFPLHAVHFTPVTTGKVRLLITHAANAVSLWDLEVLRPRP